MQLKKLILTSVIIGVAASIVYAETSSVDKVFDSFERAESMEKDIELPKTDNPAALAAAHSAASQMNSAEFQEKLKKERQRIKTVMYGGYSSDVEEQMEENQSVAGRLPADERIYLLFSESVPIDTIRTYMRDISLLHDRNITMVIRGFVGGPKKIQPTLDYIKSLLVKEKGCSLSVGNKCETYWSNIDIDPLIFRKFGVTEVPAFVYVRGVTLTYPDQSLGNGDNLQPGSDHRILYGDVSFDYALEKFAEMTGESYLTAMVKKLRAGYYGEAHE